MTASTLKLRAVTWAAGRYNTYAGTIGAVRIGGVSWRMTKADRDWIATSSFSTPRKQFDTLEEAKAWVETFTLAFVRRLVEPEEDV